MNMDPFSKSFPDPFKSPGSLNPAPSKDIFVKSKTGGGLGRVSRPVEPEEALEAEPAAPAPEPEKKKAKVLLRNPKWEIPKIGFNEETDISVELDLPPEHAHKTKVTFELFARTPKGPESISKGEGTAEAGKARCRIPVYIPNYRDEDGNLLRKVEYFFISKHSESDPLDGSKSPKVIDEMAERLLETHILAGTTFGTGKSFVQPKYAGRLKDLCDQIKAWREKNPDGKLAVFGHSDAIGERESNKKLSERRADSVFAFLTKDFRGWENLCKEEKWGLAPIQDLLRFQGLDPGASDGQNGPRTQAAIKEFQTEKGIAVDGAAGPETRTELFKAFLNACNDLDLKPKDFENINGGATAGCSELNLAENTQGDCGANRRVAVFLLKSSKTFPITYPCRKGDLEPCTRQIAVKSERRTSGFGCLFYDKLILESAPASEEPPIEEGILELVWEKPVLLAWDGADLAEMKTKVKVKTKALSPCDDAVLEILQFDPEGNHVPYRQIEGLKLDGDILYGPDGKELEVNIEWHDTIYDYGKTQYLCKLTAQDKSKVSGQARADLLQLKHFDGIVANPSGDLPGAGQEGIWLAAYLRKQGPWLEATKLELVADGHAAKMYNAIGNGTMKSLLERNKFVHHQSSHGTAYCWCSGTKTYFKDSGTAGADGFTDYTCPTCGKIDDGVGVIFLKDWSNLFFRSEVKKLMRSPKVLVLANCCLTAITPAYPKAWLDRGTRWYIGWALPVGDTEAVEFAKAFYRRWLGAYKMNPDDVRKVFNDVKGPYAEFRPRIFGK